METAADYLKRSESGARKLFEGIESLLRAFAARRAACLRQLRRQPAARRCGAGGLEEAATPKSRQRSRHSGNTLQKASRSPRSAARCCRRQQKRSSNTRPIRPSRRNGRRLSRPSTRAFASVVPSGRVPLGPRPVILAGRNQQPAGLGPHHCPAGRLPSRAAATPRGTDFHAFGPYAGSFAAERARVTAARVRSRSR